MLYTAEPVRDRNWWLRTAVYWFVLAGQLPGAANWIIALLAVVPAALAVYWRDRHPWLLALVALAATWAITDIAIAAGIVEHRRGSCDRELCRGSGPHASAGRSTGR